MSEKEQKGKEDNPALKDVEPGSDADATPVEPVKTPPPPKKAPRKV